MEVKFNELGLAQTLNNHGIMTKFNMCLTMAFLNDIEGKDVLVIGPAFRRNVNTILQKCKTCTVIDLNQQHINCLLEQVSDISLLNKLTTYYGKFPDIKLEDNAFDVVLIERVLHFFTPNEMEQVFTTIHRILRSSGRCYILTWQPDKKLLVGYWMYNIQRWLYFAHPGFLNLKILKYIFHNRWIYKIIVNIFERSKARRNNQLAILCRLPDNIYLMTEIDLFNLLKRYGFKVLTIGREHYVLPNEKQYVDTFDTIAIAVKL